MFNQKQIKELTNNKNVDKCSSTSITYNKEFKLWAVKKYYQEGFSPSMLFKQAGFNLNIMGKKKAKDCLTRWRRIYNQKGEKELIKEARGVSGGRPKIKYQNDKEKIIYLETKIAYLKAENDLLKKMKRLDKP